ncbi:hypothetical protein [Alicyclobacillus sp. ALC3]|uniref:hypothetical protein n=1 Tax=Alicyclobacillus sp. ALC3 TaxID=2796143 RepID=UPI00237815D3|nr:hypothetical protein [Alicyclobacillus sp. ALC3]WDL96808.1 hypothetical protein JC200_21360 [Alicyclobacillus sp. ALC3]
MNFMKTLRLGSTVVSMARDPNVHFLARGAWGGMKRLGGMMFKKKSASKSTVSQASPATIQPDASERPSKVAKRRSHMHAKHSSSPKSRIRKRSTKARSKSSSKRKPAS